jgi:hypothetical protein
MLKVKLRHWGRFDDAFGGFYRPIGRPAKPTRLMVGLHYLKHVHDLSDEETVVRWVDLEPALLRQLVQNARKPRAKVEQWQTVSVMANCANTTNFDYMVTAIEFGMRSARNCGKCTRKNGLTIEVSHPVNTCPFVDPRSREVHCELLLIIRKDVDAEVAERAYCGKAFRPVSAEIGNERRIKG